MYSFKVAVNFDAPANAYFFYLDYSGPESSIDKTADRLGAIQALSGSPRLTRFPARIRYVPDMSTRPRTLPVGFVQPLPPHQGPQAAYRRRVAA